MTGARKADQSRQWTTCVTGLRGYHQRVGAKSTARRLAKTGEVGMSVFRCERCDHWHIGHVPRAVLRGQIDKNVWRASA